MNSAQKKIISVLVGLNLFLAVSVHNVLAQSDSYGLAVPLVNIEGNVPSGSVICAEAQDYKLCDNIYDNSIIGISTNNPASSLQIDTLDNGPYLITSGIASVRVSNDNGPVLAGDLLTSSDQPGVAIKATQNGFVVGAAAEALDSEEGNILVSINIHQTTAFAGSRNNLIELLRQGLTAAVLTPLEALRYLLAALVTIISFVLAFVYYGRISKTGVEAIGRNPLAKRSIQNSVMLHLVITVIICLVGFAMAYFILAI